VGRAGPPAAPGGMEGSIGSAGLPV